MFPSTPANAPPPYRASAREASPRGRQSTAPPPFNGPRDSSADSDTQRGRAMNGTVHPRVITSPSQWSYSDLFSPPRANPAPRDRSGRSASPQREPTGSPTPVGRRNLPAQGRTYRERERPMSRDSPIHIDLPSPLANRSDRGAAINFESDSEDDNARLRPRYRRSEAPHHPAARTANPRRYGTRHLEPVSPRDTSTGSRYGGDIVETVLSVPISETRSGCPYWPPTPGTPVPLEWHRHRRQRHLQRRGAVSGASGVVRQANLVLPVDVVLQDRWDCECGQCDCCSCESHDEDVMDYDDDGPVEEDLRPMPMRYGEMERVSEPRRGRYAGRAYDTEIRRPRYRR